MAAQDDSNDDNAFSSLSSSSSSSSSSSFSSYGSRRRVLASTIGAALGAGAAGVVALGGAPRPAQARLQGPAKPEELARLVTGYQGLVYLLENFDQETTKCTPDCNRNPDAVRSYLGLRSMEHPLYQIEKVMQKGQDNIEDVDMLGDYIEAVESWSSCISESNAMAYTSSFGEYNPGGGKDVVSVVVGVHGEGKGEEGLSKPRRSLYAIHFTHPVLPDPNEKQVEKFLVKSKEQVVLAKNQLKIIIDILGLKV